jgi:hypothetical protein
MKLAHSLKLSAACAFACGLSLTARAQVGSGWTSYSPGLELQESGDVTHSTSGGVETFSINDSSNDTVQRCEQRAEDDVDSGGGTRQFQGIVQVTSLGGSGISLQQDKAANGGTWNMIAINSADGGSLYCVGVGTTIATGVLGIPVQINTVTDADALTTKAYVNGSLESTLNNITPPIYHKYGTYRLDSGEGPITAEWSNTQYWESGVTSGSTTTSYEATNLTVTNSGVGTSVQTDSNLPNGEWVELDATNSGSWMQFTTPSIPAGTYSLSMLWKNHNDRGIASFKVDGNSIGSNLDQYSTTQGYPTTTIGTLTFFNAGTHTIRLTVAGKNSASSGYLLSAAQFNFSTQ